MGAILGGTMRSPFTGVVFTLELTHDVNAIVPLLVAVTIAHAVTVLTLRRSILTEKVSRRGYHLSREYAVDPLEILFVREVMRREVVALDVDASSEDVAAAEPQRLYPVVDRGGCLVGVVRRSRLLARRNAALAAVIERDPVVAHPDEPLRVVAYRMAETGLTRLPVVERDGTRRLLGMVSLRDLLQGRVRNLEAERRRERFLPLRVRPPWRMRRVG